MIELNMRKNKKYFWLRKKVEICKYGDMKQLQLSYDTKPKLNETYHQK